MKYKIDLTLELPTGEALLDREELLGYILDAVSTWYGQLNPEDQLWELSRAKWRIATKTPEGPLIFVYDREAGIDRGRGL